MSQKEVDDLLAKVSLIHQDLGGRDGSKSPSKGDNRDQFQEVKIRVAERLHRLKANLQDQDNPKKKARPPSEVVRRQQEVREDFQLISEDIEALGQICDRDQKKKRLKFSAEELQMRRDTIQQYASELSVTRELAITIMRSNRGAARSDKIAASSPSVSNSDSNPFSTAPTDGAMTTSAWQSSTAGTSDMRKEELTDEHRSTMAQIKKNDEKFDTIIDQIGVGVKELGQLAQGLNDEVQHQAIMLDDLNERMENAKEQVVTVNAKMRKALSKSGRGADRCIMEFICLILLLGVLAVVYNMFIKPKDASSD